MLLKAPKFGERIGELERVDELTCIDAFDRSAVTVG